MSATYNSVETLHSARTLLTHMSRNFRNTAYIPLLVKIEGSKANFVLNILLCS